MIGRTREIFSMIHRTLILAAALLLAAPTAAFADAIDGNWCSKRSPDERSEIRSRRGVLHLGFAHPG